MERDEFDQFFNDENADSQQRDRNPNYDFYAPPSPDAGFVAKDEQQSSDIAAMGQMDILTLIDFLVGEISGASSLPLTNKKLVDGEKCMSIIHDIRMNLPEAIVHANSTLQNRAMIIQGAEGRAADLVNSAQAQALSILDNANRAGKTAIQNAQQQATSIREDAENRAAALTSDTTVMQRAESEARNAMGDARRKANQISSDALKYTVDILNELKKVLGEQLENVDENLKNLMPDQTQNRQ